MDAPSISRFPSSLTRAAAARRSRHRVLLALIVLGAAADATADDLSITIRSRSLRPGEAILVAVKAPVQTTGITIDAFGSQWTAFRANDTTWRALIGIDLDQRPGTYTLVAASSTPHVARTTREIVVAPRQFRQRVLKVAPDYVNPPADLLARIRSESEFMTGVYQHSSAEPKWQQGLIRPVKDPANSSFGTRSVFNGEPRSPHAGTDFLSGAGTPIHAPAGGRVVAARDLFFTGNTVIIDHGLGVFSMLAHLSRIDIQEGQTIDSGEIVGLVGATGRVTGPHLHWALRAGSARVDPLSALALFTDER
jgi:murein DD-endopeptidase MepM/ murein hydrolase activator NlpD